MTIHYAYVVKLMDGENGAVVASSKASCCGQSLPTRDNRDPDVVGTSIYSHK